MNATIRHHVFFVLTISVLVTPMARADYVFQSLVSFNGTNNGNGPSNLTLDASGNLYGFTASGGANGDGTVFEIAKGSNSITTLANFANPIGSPVFGPLAIDSQGNLYGTTGGNGTTGNDGTVFEVVKGSNTITTLATFNGTTNGSYPKGSVAVDANGNLYGTSGAGSPFGLQTVFEVVKGSNTITTLATFNGTTNGLFPQGQVIVDAQGNIYSFTGQGGTGTAPGGTVFEVVKGSNTITTLGNLSGGGPNGITFDAQGNIWGTTGSYVFEIVKGTTTVKIVATLPSSGIQGSEINPGNPVFDSQGNLYGTATDGGTGGDGTVWELAKGSSTFTILLNFGGPDGRWPSGGLLVDSHGDLFGSTGIGGVYAPPYGDGTVFEFVNTAASVPEPSSIALLGLGFAGLYVISKRRKVAPALKSV